jgi:hypothetical protein
VLVVGESGQSNDLHDAQAIKHLILAHQPTWEVRALKRPAVLAKGKEKALAKAANRIAKLYRQASGETPIHAVFNHADTDEVEPSHVPAAEVIEASLADAGCPGYAAVCAWELEAWFFLWPDAIEATRRAWKVPKKLRGRDVGQLADPKAVMRREVLKGASRPQLAYQEKHAPEVAQQIAPRIHDREGKSRSYDRFVARIEACARA